MMHEPRVRFARFARWMASAIVALAATLFLLPGPLRVGESRLETLVNLEGWPAPPARIDRARVVAFPWPSERSRPTDSVPTVDALLPLMQIARPDLVILWDLPLVPDGGDIAQRVAAELGLPWIVRHPTWSRAIGCAPSSGQLARSATEGVVLISRWPVIPLDGARPGAIHVSVLAPDAGGLPVLVHPGEGHHDPTALTAARASCTAPPCVNALASIQPPSGWTVLRNDTSDTFDGRLPRPAVRIEIARNGALDDGTGTPTR